MTRLLAALLTATLATCTPARAAVTTYADAVYGTVAGLTVAASVEVQIDGTPAVGSVVKARARLTSDPGPYPVSRAWSRWYTATINGKPFRADIDITGLKGRLGVDWSTSNLTIAADGTAGGFAVYMPPQRLALARVEAGSTNTAPAPVTPSSGILTRVYKKGGQIGFDAKVPASWPRKRDKDKTVNAIACINGRKFDFVAPGQDTKTLKNLYDDPDYFQPIRRGETVTFSLKDINGKNETARLPIVWEWESTVR